MLLTLAIKLVLFSSKINLGKTILSVQRYQPKHKVLWNSFVSKAKNATFLFYRDFMEYHQDRFDDFSLLIFKGNKIISLFPANIKDSKVYSHQGLTFGSFLLPKKVSEQDVFFIFQAVCEFYKSQGKQEIFIKQIPEIYFKLPSHEQGFIIAQKAKLYRRDMVLAIDYSKPLAIHKTKLKHFKKAGQFNFENIESNNFKPFWD